MSVKIINLNEELIKNIGITITNNVDFLVSDKNYTKICAAHDRIREIVNGLNSKLFYIKSGESAFDFYEFLEQSFVLVDAIKILANSLSNKKGDCYHLLENKLQTKTINAKDITGNGNDYKFFKYLRSLCSAHPVGTNQHPDYSNIEEWCPYANWINKDEIDVMIYDSNNKTRILKISVLEIVHYVDYCYNQLLWIKDCLDKYLDRRKESFKRKTLKGPSSFNNYTDYLEYLKKENRKRMDSNSDCFNLVSLLMSTKISTSNTKKYDYYINCIKKAITFEHNRIQKMTSDRYDCRGTINKNTSLLNEILYPSIDSECKTMGTILGKMEKLIQDESNYLGSNNPSPSDITFARECKKYDVLFVRDMIMRESDYFSKYVMITEDTSDSELFVLIHIAHFMEALEKNDGVYGELKNIT